MNNMLLRIWVSFALLFFFLSDVTFAQSHVKGKAILVKYSSKIDANQKQKLRKTLEKNASPTSPSKHKASKVFRSPSTHVELFHLEDGLSLANFLSSPAIVALTASGKILDIELDHEFELSAVPNDPDFDLQWGLENTGQNSGTAGADIGAIQAWNLQTAGSGILGLVDTGVDFAHPDLVENIWQNLAEDADGDGKVLEFINGRWELDPGDLDGIDADGNGYIDDLIGWDFVNNDNNPYDDNGHGTHVAGIIGAKGDNGIGVSGVAWQTEIMVLKAFGSRGQGSLSNILPALEYARNMGVSLTNNSWGGLQYSRFLVEEIIRARDAEQIFVAAAGNSGYANPNAPIYPASYAVENIISVSASTESDRLAGFSSYGRRTVDLAAPGQRIYSTLPGGTYGSKSGTSMAAAFVSGAILLLKAQDPNLNMGQIISRIFLNVELKPALFAKCRSGGRLNLMRALQNTVAQTSSSGLFAAFSGPHGGCVNTPLNFINTSLIPNEAQTNITWYLDGLGLSTDRDLTYTFTSPGFYELKLVLIDGSEREEAIQVIEITPVAGTLDLGPDTSLCASAYVLQTNSIFEDIRWIKLNCPNNTNCLGPNDFTNLDSLRFSANGGNTTFFANSFILADEQDQILEVAPNLVFSPQDTGNYRMYAVYHWPDLSPGGMQVGNYISDIDLGIDTCGQVSPFLSFRVHHADLLGRGSFVTVDESGLYVLDITDACGNRASDTLRLSLTPGCVWPGDINDDGQVSMLDFLSLGIAQQQIGLPRPNASSNWVGQASPDWTTSFDSANVLAPGLNHKHADANGDGIVDLNLDLQIVEDNMGFFHEIDIPPVGEGPALYLEHLNTLYSSEGDTAEIEVGIFLEGANETDVQDFYGIAFNLNFSDPILEKPDLSPTNDWLGPMEKLTLFTDGSQSGFGAQFLPIDRRKAGFGMVSSNRRSSRGRGLIAGGIIIVTIDDIAGDSVSSEFSSFSITSENMVVIDSLGRAISSPVSNSLNTISIDLNWNNPTCSELGLADTDTDQVCDIFDICPGYDDFAFPKNGLIQLTPEGNSFNTQRINFLNNRIQPTSLSNANMNLALTALAYESDSSYLAMVNDGSGTLANYRMQLLANGNFSSTLLNPDNRFTSFRYADQVMGMAKYDSLRYLIAFRRSNNIELYTGELAPTGNFTNNRLRSSVSGLPLNTLALAKKEGNEYYLLVNDGGLFPALYVAVLQSDWTFTTTLITANARISKSTQDFAFIGGKDCPSCQTNCGMSISLKLLLEGPYDATEGLMDDFYRSDGRLSYTDPYGLNTQLDPALLIPTDHRAVVDWMKVQLRSASDPSQVLAEKAVLLQRDGNMIDKEGNAVISFDGIANQNYYISVGHGSHLGVMTAAPLDLTTSPYIDFTSPLTQVYSLGGPAMKDDQGVRLLWAGDANGDGKINAIDKNLYWIPQNGNSFIYGTTWADFNLDGLVNAIDLNFYWLYNNSLVEQIP